MCPGYFDTDYCMKMPMSLTPQVYNATYAPYFPTTSSAAYDPMSMYGSVYGNADIDLTSDCSVGVGGYTPGGFGGGYDAGMTGAYGYNPDSMYQQMDKWTDYMYDRNVKYTEKGRANDLRINGPLDAAQYAADALKEKIEKDDQPQIQLAFEKYKAAIRNLYPEYANLDDKALTAKAMELYKQRNNIGIKDDIRDKSNNIFVQKFLNGATFGMGWNGSGEETIEKITGNPMSREDKIKGALGTTAGAAASITAGFQIAKHWKPIAKVAAKNPITAVLLAAAAAVGIYSYNKS